MKVRVWTIPERMLAFTGSSHPDEDIKIVDKKSYDKVIVLLRKILPYADAHCDRGPTGEGWQSDELAALIEEATKFLEELGEL